MSESAVTKWVDRLQEAVGWREPGWEYDWSVTESTLGVALPSDYKALCERFGPGSFSSSIWMLGDDTMEDSLLGWWNSYLDWFRDDVDMANMVFSPYGYYGSAGSRGLIQWGNSDAPGCFFWLADAGEDPDTWPVVATNELVLEPDWKMPGVSTSEYVYRMVTDPESEPLSMLRPQLPPTFKRGPAV